MPASLCATRATLARAHSTHRRLAPCLRGAAKNSAVVIENATVSARALHDFEGASLKIFFRAGRRGRGADGGRVRVLDSLSADWSDGMPKKRLSPEKKEQSAAKPAGRVVKHVASVLDMGLS